MLSRTCTLYRASYIKRALVWPRAVCFQQKLGELLVARSASPFASSIQKKGRDKGGVSAKTQIGVG